MGDQPLEIAQHAPRDAEEPDARRSRRRARGSAAAGRPARSDSRRSPSGRCRRRSRARRARCRARVGPLRTRDARHAHEGMLGADHAVASERTLTRPSARRTTRSATRRTSASSWVIRSIVGRAREPLERVGDERGALGVEIRRGLVEDEERRVAQQRAGQRQAADLSGGEPDAPFAERRRVPVRQRGDEGLGTCAPRSIGDVRRSPHRARRDGSPPRSSRRRGAAAAAPMRGAAARRRRRRRRDRCRRRAADRRPGRSNRRSRRAIVLLPAPLGPTSATPLAAARARARASTEHVALAPGIRERHVLEAHGHVARVERLDQIARPRRRRRRGGLLERVEDVARRRDSVGARVELRRDAPQRGVQLGREHEDRQRRRERRCHRDRDGRRSRPRRRRCRASRRARAPAPRGTRSAACPSSRDGSPRRSRRDDRPGSRRG